MKEHLTIILTLFLIAGAIGCGSSDNPIDTNSGSIIIEVASIEETSVHVQLMQNGQLVTQTDGNSTIQLSGIETGNYTLQVSAEGYQTKELYFSYQSGKTILIDMGELVQIVDGIALGDGLAIGTEAPDFKLSDGLGESYALSDYIADNKKVVIVFYRTGT